MKQADAVKIIKNSEKIYLYKIINKNIHEGESTLHKTLVGSDQRQLKIHLTKQLGLRDDSIWACCGRGSSKTPALGGWTGRVVR